MIFSMAAFSISSLCCSTSATAFGTSTGTPRCTRYGPILCYGWKGNNIQPMSKDVQAEMLDRLKDTEVRV